LKYRHLETDKQILSKDIIGTLGYDCVLKEHYSLQKSHERRASTTHKFHLHEDINNCTIVTAYIQHYIEGTYAI